MSSPEVYVVGDHALLLDAVAARLVTRLVDLQTATGHARVLLGGDPLVAELLVRLGDSPARDAVDWEHLHLWWSDDTWAPADDPSRAVNAAAPLLRAVELPAGNLHPMPPQSAGGTPEEAAAARAGELSAARSPDDHTPVPTFDLAVLGLGDEGSVAGLRPEQPAVHDPRPVVADRGSGRITLTLAGLSTSREVWLLASGAGSAAAAVLTLSGAGSLQVPAAGVRGTQRTLVLLDEAAATRLPVSLRRIASP